MLLFRELKIKLILIHIIKEEENFPLMVRIIWYHRFFFRYLFNILIINIIINYYNILRTICIVIIIYFSRKPNILFNLIWNQKENTSYIYATDDI